MAAAAAVRRITDVAARKAKERWKQAQVACNVVDGFKGLVLDGGRFSNYVTSGQLKEKPLDQLQMTRLTHRNGGRCAPAPKGAVAFAQLLAMLLCWRPEGQKGGETYGGVQLALRDIVRLGLCSARQWGREGGTLDWLVHYGLVIRIPTTVIARREFKNRAGRHVRVREGVPIYVAGEALLQLLQRQQHRANVRLLRVARKLAKMRSQSSGGLGSYGTQDLPGCSEGRQATEEPVAPRARAVREADLLLTQLQRVAPWWSKESRKARRQKVVERKKRKDAPASDGGGALLEHHQASPAAAGDPIAASVPSAPAAPATLPWEPPSAPAFATPAPLAELRALLAGVRLAVDAAPDVEIGPMPLGEPCSSQRLDDGERKPTGLAGMLAAIVARNKP